MDDKGINNRIKQLFEQLGPDNKPYKSTYVSKMTGIGRVSLDYYRKGIQTPSAINAGKIADFFGVSQDWLITGKGEMQPQSNIQQPEEQIPAWMVQMMHDERMKHYEENRLLIEQNQQLLETVNKQMEELKKMLSQKEENAGCADVG